MSGSQKRKMWKMKGEGSGPLYPLEVTSVRIRGACNSRGRYNNNGCSPVCLPLWSEAAISDRSTVPWYLKDRVLFPHSDSHKQCVSCSRNMYTASCQVGRGGRWAAATVWRAEFNLSFTTHVFLGRDKTSTESRVPQQLNQTLCQCNFLCRLGDRLLVLPILLFSQNPLPMICVLSI